VELYNQLHLLTSVSQVQSQTSASTKAADSLFAATPKGYLKISVAH
jgi:hypothetical protein